MREHLIRLGCPARKIRVVRIGVDVSAIRFAPNPPSDHLTVLQAARLVEKKGVDVAIRAFAAAQRRASLAKLIIVGDGPERRRLEILASELGVADQVRFLGALPYDEYQRVLACAHIGIQPSRIAEDGDTEGGAPTVLIEMQAAGLPIVGTRHADIPFVVAHPENLVDEEDVGGLASVLIRLANTPTSVWGQRAVEARAFVARHHDAPRVAKEIAAVYREALR
jgi:glycosyltransferase involved in cell wall biosynthesis